MEDLIAQLDLVRSALGTLDIRSTRHNLDNILGSIQIIDRVIGELKEMGRENSERKNQM